jgi:hypothetical protein
MRGQVHRIRRDRVHVSTSATVIWTPSQSRIHQRAKADSGWRVDGLLSISTAIMPNTAATAAPASDAAERIRGSRTRSSRSSKPKRVSRRRSTTASSTTATATAMADAIDMWRDVAMSAPTAMPGMRRTPPRRKAATATPAAGHIGMT